MQCKLQLVIGTDDGCEETVTDFVTLTKNCERIEHLGLTLAEAKQLLNTIQQHLLERQVTAFLTPHAHCETCGTALKVKGTHTRAFRTTWPWTLPGMEPRGLDTHPSLALGLCICHVLACRRGCSSAGTGFRAERSYHRGGRTL